MRGRNLKVGEPPDNLWKARKWADPECVPLSQGRGKVVPRLATGVVTLERAFPHLQEFSWIHYLGQAKVPTTPEVTFPNPENCVQPSKTLARLPA